MSNIRKFLNNEFMFFENVDACSDLYHENFLVQTYDDQLGLIDYNGYVQLIRIQINSMELREYIENNRCYLILNTIDPINETVSFRIHVNSSVINQTENLFNEEVVIKDGIIGIDILQEILNYDSFYIEFYSDSSNYIEFESTGLNRPHIEIIIEKEIDPIITDVEIIKGNGKVNIDLIDGNSVAYLDLLNIKNASLPLDIKLKYNSKSQSWNLNLDEILIRTSREYNLVTNYSYYDSNGIHHNFYEKYYYLFNGEKIYIPESLIEIKVDGSLFYEGNEVHFEKITCNGLKLVSEIKEYKNIDFYEDRTEEEINLEENNKNYLNAFKEYVVLNTYTGNIQSYLKDLVVLNEINENSIINFLNGINKRNILLSENEALMYKEIISKEQSNTNDDNDSDRKNIIISKANDNLLMLKSYFKNYLLNVGRLKEIENYKPVNYLINEDEIIHGFNSKGYLCLIGDRYENYLIIDRENEKIKSIYDKERKIIDFKYELNDSRIHKIIDDNGDSIEFIYDNNQENKLSKILKNNKVFYEFEYLNDRFIIKKNASISRLIYNDSKLIRVENVFDETLLNNQQSNISEQYNIAYNENNLSTSISYNLTKNHFYQYNSDRQLIKYQYINLGVIEETKEYEYVDNDVLISKITNSTFDREDVILERYSYLDNNKIDQIIVEGRMISNLVEEIKTTSYFYNEDDLLIKEENKYQYKNNGIIDVNKDVIEITEYYYNIQKDLVKKESYLLEEIDDKGKNIVEIEYDNDGNVIKEYSYNSLDSGSRFYNETNKNSNGLILSSLDELGINKTNYLYQRGRLKEVIYPNSSRIGYGYDEDDRLTQISQSTLLGEENSQNINYKGDLISKVISNDEIVEYSYDYKDRIIEVKINDEVVESYTYVENNGRLIITKTDENNNVIYIVKDQFSNIRNISYNGNLIYNATYNEKNKLVELNESSYSYNSLGYLIRYENGTYSEVYSYNDYGDITNVQISLNNINHEYEYIYKNNKGRELDFIILPNNIKSKLLRDKNNRNAGKELLDVNDNKIYGEYLSYLKIGDHATNIPNCIYYGMKVDNKYLKTTNIKYSYNNMGKIDKIYENGILSVRYDYDLLGRLIREDNKKLNETYLYSYDSKGNILTKRIAEYTSLITDEINDFIEETYYFYDKQKLIKVGNDEISYGTSGYPIQYKGNSISYRFDKRIINYGDNTFQYDELGKRICKNNISYTYDSNNNLIKQSDGINVLEYFYDNNGLVGFNYNNTNYIYQKDIQGNIIGIINTNTNEIEVEYLYDAWGRCIILNDSNNLGTINPFRYRGYYYDEETSLYYITSRYYDPEIGRFISPDSVDYLDPTTINGLNLYAYCNNDPVNNIDPTGHFVITGSVILWAVIIGFAAGAVIGGAAGGISAATTGDNVGLGILFGAIGGGIMGAGAGIGATFIAPIIAGGSAVVAGHTLSVGAAWGIGLGIGFTSGAIGGGTQDFLNQMNSNEWNITKIDPMQMGWSALENGALNTLSTVLGGFGGVDLSRSISFILGAQLNIIPSGYTLISDILRWYYSKRRQS